MSLNIYAHITIFGLAGLFLSWWDISAKPWKSFLKKPHFYFYTPKNFFFKKYTQRNSLFSCLFGCIDYPIYIYPLHPMVLRGSCGSAKVLEIFPPLSLWCPLQTTGPLAVAQRISSKKKFFGV